MGRRPVAARKRRAKVRGVSPDRSVIAVTGFATAYVEVQQLFDTVIPFGAHRCYWKSRYLSGLSDEAIETVAARNAAPPSPNSLSSIWNFGGATAAVPPDATAFGDRSMPWMVSFDGIWTDADDDDANIAWSRGSWEALSPYAAGDRIYQNFPGLGEDPALIRRSFGPTWDRLVEVKRRYDPDNVFRFNQNIAPG
jgi:hypothetical protein